MNELEAKKLFNAPKWPYGVRYKDEIYVIVKVRLDILREDNPVRHPERIEGYKRIIREQGNMDPVWPMFGRKMKDGRICPFKRPKLRDGNHRTKASKDLGLKYINAIMPESQYSYYKEVYCGQVD